MAKPRKYNLNSGTLLKNRLDYSILTAMAAKHFYRSRSLKIFIGLSKIFHAIVLLMLYLERAPWDEKIPKTVFFVTTTLITYAIEYGISTVWWRHYFAKFSKSNSQHKFIICTSNPAYSGKYVIKIFDKTSLSFFQRLGTPVIEEELEFADYFTESGYYLEQKFTNKFNNLIESAIYHKDK